jgi:hypothetical protein
MTNETLPIKASRVDYQYGLLVVDGDQSIGFIVHDHLGFRMAKPGESPSIWDEYDDAIHAANRVLEIYENLGLERMLGDLVVKVQKRPVITRIGEWED